MNEVEKMYRNSGIKKYKKTMLDIETGKDVLTLDSFYPEFTAEKQLELIKWLVHYIKQINITDAFSGEFYFTAFGYVSYIKVDFDEALASFTNSLWQDLTEEERKQIKEILE